MPSLAKRIAAAVLVLPLTVASGAAAGSPTVPSQIAQSVAPAEAAGDQPAAEPEAGAKDKAESPDADGKTGEAEPPGTRSLDLTPIQCESLALGRPLKDLPPDARIETITFTEPPPVTLKLPTQSREALTECSLRASGLTVRYDRARKVITLLPTGTRSPELPNPSIKVTLKFTEGDQPDSP